VLTEGDLDAVRRATGTHTDPEDFDAFWADTLAEAATYALEVTVTPAPHVLTAIDVADVTFTGAGGTRVRAWLRTPAGATGPLPTVVTYVGYGGGRGRPEADLTWAAAGFAHLQMDTRGQGSGWSTGDTADDAGSGPQVPGVMTRGIGSRETYYYRRLVTDAVRAVDAARELPVVDPSRIAVAGGSQGGALTLAVAGLRDDIAAAAAFVPFLCDIRRAVQITDAYPYREVADYLRVHRDRVEAVHEVLRYFDGIAFARRATAPMRFSVALMDVICPPSTVYAAHNAYAGPTRIDEWPYNGHEGGEIEDEVAAVRFLREHLG
jgi:cephalosporin-C deacetylase